MLNRNLLKAGWGLLVLLIAGHPLFAQDDESRPIEQRVLRYTIRFDGGLGFLHKPQAMRSNFYSVGDAGLGMVFGLGKGINLGLTGHYTGFQVSPHASNIYEDKVINGIGIKVPIATTCNLWSPGVFLSYDRFVSPYSFFSFSLNPSFSFVRWAKLRQIDPADTKLVEQYAPYTPDTYNKRVFSIQPAVSFHYFFEDHVGVSFKLGFTRTWAVFEPEKVRLDGGAISYVAADINGPIQFITVGLGFIYSFKRVE